MDTTVLLHQINLLMTKFFQKPEVELFGREPRFLSPSVLRYDFPNKENG